jgi:hypothetical protein
MVAINICYRRLLCCGWLSEKSDIDNCTVTDGRYVTNNFTWKDYEWRRFADVILTYSTVQ